MTSRKEYKRAWYLAHKNDPKVKAGRKAAQRRWRAKYPEKNNAISARHRRKHRDEVNAKLRIYSSLHRDEANKRAKAWFKMNRERARDNNLRRRDRETDGSEDCKSVIKSLLRSEHCYWCHSEFDLIKRPEIDHVHPLSRGGRHTRNNLVASCVRCNREKHDRLYWELDGELAS